MPAVKVLLGGTTRDFRLCFRNWDMKEKGLGGDVGTALSAREALEGIGF